MKPIVLTLTLLFSLNLFAQKSNKELIYDSYINKDMDLWKNTIVNMKNTKSNDLAYNWELLNYQYGYIAWCLGPIDNKKQADKYLEIARENLEEISEKDTKNKDLALAYEAAFYGYEIGITPFKAPFIGGKSLKRAKESLKLNDNNYFTHIQFGNIMYYMPGIFGGDKKVAIQSYKKAKTIMEQDTALIKNNWLYINLILTIADAYKQEKDFDSVEKYYLEVLAIEPTFKWVRDELYPSMIKQRDEFKK